MDAAPVLAGVCLCRDRHQGGVKSLPSPFNMNEEVWDSRAWVRRSITRVVICALFWEAQRWCPVYRC